MFVKRRFIRIMLILLSALLIVSVNVSCIRVVRQAAPGPSQGQLPPEGQSTDPTRPHPPVRTGEISLGQKVDITSQSIDASGGTIAVTKPGDPLDGFVISVPPQSYADSRIFKISSAPINYQTFGNDIHPISPMISVDNGGGYADETMYVRVPVEIPEGYFAMGFLYDEKTKQLEGMPLVGMDAESVTVATTHFSNFFISMVEKTLLKDDVDSGFRPGIDDWQFINRGSYIAPGGHCEGQALSAMWYYCAQPDGQDLCLYGRYDNNGDRPATPDLWQDDSLGYRFCSVIQKEKKVGFSKNFWENLSGKNWEWKNNKWELKDVPGIGDEAIFNLFAYSIRATGEPQEVAIWNKAGGGHAMIVYKSIGNALYIADPNYPGNTDRKIIFYSGEGKFKPYNSGANRKEIDAGNGKAYESIIYMGKSTIVSWDTIAQRWSEFKNKTIGNDKFPGYDIVWIDDKGDEHPLVDGFEASDKLIDIAASGKNFSTGISVFRDGKPLKYDDKGRFELNPGNNKLGIYIQGDANNNPNNSDWEYVDFKYINVIYESAECSIDPAQVEGEVNDQYTFTALMSKLPAKPTYEWYFNGNLASTGQDNKYSMKFTAAGSHNVSVRVLNDKGDVVGEATAVVEIKASEESPCKFSDVCKPVTPQIKIQYCCLDSNKVAYNPPGKPIGLFAHIPKEQPHSGIIFKWTIDNGGTIEKKEYKGSTGGVSFTPKAEGTYKVKVECFCSSCPDIKVGEAEDFYTCNNRP